MFSNKLYEAYNHKKEMKSMNKSDVSEILFDHANTVGLSFKKET